MSVIFVMAPIALLLAAAAVAAFLWAARDGQFDDTETPAHRMLFDDEPRSESVGPGADLGDEAPRSIPPSRG